MSNNLQALQQALLGLKDLRSRLDAVTREPIAIVGMGCRFPGGASSPEAFWRLLSDGVDAIRETPAERWNVEDYYAADPDAPGFMSVKFGGFLSDVDAFDAAFFGIAPREAPSIDPQHRLLLEVAWEALENAGQAPSKLNGTQTGVYVGITSLDYLLNQAGAVDLDNIDAYCGTGNSPSVASGRLSYHLGLRGPSMSVDTACSSSLVALHLACQALRARECDLALAGGVNLLLSPIGMIAFSKAHMLAPDGRCKTFDAAANGYVRSEGCGVIVLKRLSDALAGTDNILAVVRGSAVNQDGASGGLTVPNGPSQEAVVRKALAAAGVTPAEVGYVEAHGTGTSLGDPIEARALGEVFGRDRPAGLPLLVGSVKTNLGHLEAAAGIAGLIKTVLALQHAEIPPHLHLKQPSPHIAWDTLPIRVPATRVPWPSSSPATARIAGVSAFAFNGTNAHVILEAGPAGPKPKRGSEGRPSHILAVSARSETALKELAHRYETHFGELPHTALSDLCYSANAGRSHFTHRLSVVAASSNDAQRVLGEWRRGGNPPELHRAKAGTKGAGEIAFLFTGQGSQFAGMGRQLYETQATFRAAMDRCAELLAPDLPIPLLSALYPAAGEISPIDETSYAQPALFSLEYALVELWKSWGIEPGAVLGHSVGEYAAACAAGVFTLEEAIRLIAERGRRMQALPPGGMAAIFAGEDEVREEIHDFPEVSVAAINGPSHVVLSPAPRMFWAGPWFTGDSFLSIPVSVDPSLMCFTSSMMEPMLAGFEQHAAATKLSSPKLLFASGLSGSAAGEEVTDPRYWARQIREPVRFGAALETLRREGYDTFIEIGPSPVLLGMAQAAGSDIGLGVPSLRKGKADWSQILDGLAQLYVHGADVDWEGFDRDYRRRKTALPTYPFERRRYWLPSADSRKRRAPSSAERGAGRPSPALKLLPQPLESPLADIQFEMHWNAEQPVWVTDHCVYDHVVVPAACHLALAAKAGERLTGKWGLSLQEITFHQALVMSEGQDRTVQLVLSPQDEHQWQFKTASLDGRWMTHATGALVTAPAASPPAAPRLAELQQRITREWTGAEAFYDRLWRTGIQLGSSFRWLEQLWLGEREAIGRMRVRRHSDAAEDSWLHPGLLDSCFQVVGTLFSEDVMDCAWIPIGVKRLWFHAQPGGRVWCHARLESEPTGETFTAGFHLFDDTGVLVGGIDELQMKRAPRESLMRTSQQGPWKLVYQLEWRQNPVPASAAVAPGTSSWLMVSGDGADHTSVAEQIARHAGERGIGCVIASNDGARDLAAFSRILYVVGADRSTPDPAACRELLALAQSLARLDSVARPRLWVITRGAQHIEAGDGIQLDGSLCWGLSRVIRLEHPELWGGLIDLGSTFGDIDAAAVIHQILGEDGEDQIALRSGQRYVARLVRSRPGPSADVRVHGDATYLITGGFGALGLETARWLSHRGARHLVLVGRSGPSAEGTRIVQELVQSGTAVVVEQADVADALSLTGVVQRIGASMPPLRGVIHAAGTLRDAAMLQQNWESFIEVMAPKVLGAWNLHRVTRDLPLDFFVLFSSAASVLGSPGQANYAAANAFLDGLSFHRRAEGLPSLTVNWGPWSGAGMAASNRQADRRWASGGMESVSSELALELLGELLERESPPQCIAVKVDWDVFSGQVHGAAVPSLLEELVAATARPHQLLSQRRELLELLAAVAPGDRQHAVMDYVRGQACRVLEMDSTAQLDSEQALGELGLDSLMALDLTKLLGVASGLQLPATLVFNYPSIRALSGYFLEKLDLRAKPESPGTAADAARDELAAMTESVERLSNEEVQAMLESELASLDDSFSGGRK